MAPGPERPIAWLGSSLDDVRAFPEDARRAAGYQLRRVQQGLAPTDWRPMTTIGPGVVEIRLHTRVEHRVFYVAKFDEAVYVIHAFEKRTRKTSASDMALAQRRFAELVQRRARKPRSRNL